MFDLGKGLEWLIAIAQKAEESPTNTYMESKSVRVKDKFVGEYSLKVRVGINHPVLRRNKEKDCLPE